MPEQELNRANVGAGFQEVDGSALFRIRNRRHTFGTRWLQAGGDIYKLSKILGHSSVAVIEQHYAHLLKEDLVAASQQVKIPVAPRGKGNVVRMPRRHG